MLSRGNAINHPDGYVLPTHPAHTGAMLSVPQEIGTLPMQDKRMSHTNPVAALASALTNASPTEQRTLEDNVASHEDITSSQFSRRESNQGRQVETITPLMSTTNSIVKESNQGTQVEDTIHLMPRTNSTDRTPCRDSTSSQFTRRRSNQETQAEDSVPFGSEANSIDQKLSVEGTSSDIRRRGPNQGTQVPTNPMKRTRIAMHNNRFIQPNIVRDITNDIKGHYNKVWPTWHKVMRSSKDLLWENFKRRNIWDIPDMQMRKIWNENGGARFRDMIFKA